MLVGGVVIGKYKPDQFFGRIKMKKNLFPFLISILLISCSDIDITTPFEGVKMRDAAYASLSDIEKESITIDLEDAPVLRGYYSNKSCTNGFVSNKGDLKCFSLNDANMKLRDSQILGAVVFNTSNDALLGPLIIIVEPENNLVIGRVFRY